MYIEIFFIKLVTCPIRVLMFFFLVHERRHNASKVG